MEELPILPSQYFERNHNQPPEKRLLWAVLTGAIPEYLGHPNARGSMSNGLQARLEWEAEWWIFESKGRTICDFEPLCDELEIDASALRKALREYKQRRLAGEIIPNRAKFSGVRENHVTAGFLERR